LVKSSISSTFIEKPRNELGTARTSVVVMPAFETGREGTTGDAAAAAGIPRAPKIAARIESDLCRRVRRRERALASTDIWLRVAAPSD
jgi:hypothetical protein